MVATPVDIPETRNRIPKIELFHNGRALKADKRIPEKIPSITA